MLSLKLNLASGYPTGIIVSARRGSTYEIIQYLAANCSTFGPAVLTDDLPSVESVNCQRFDRLVARYTDSCVVSGVWYGHRI